MFWRCKYHLVGTPKCRFKILRDKLGKERYRTIYILCKMKDCEILELNIQPDHVHLVVIVPPKLSTTEYNRRSIAETAMYRVKQLFGGSLTLRDYDSQVAEAMAMVRALNKMTKAGMPEIVRIA